MFHANLVLTLMFRVILNVCQYAILCHFNLNSFVSRHFQCLSIYYFSLLHLKLFYFASLYWMGFLVFNKQTD